MRQLLCTAVIFATAIVAASLAEGVTAPTASSTASAAGDAFVAPPMPKGPEGDLITFGKQIIEDTHRYAMPYGSSPNTLTAQQAYDVSAYVLSHSRPKFNGQRIITFPPRKVSFY